LANNIAALPVTSAANISKASDFIGSVAFLAASVEDPKERKEISK
jgi:hypothetical protein